MDSLFMNCKFLIYPSIYEGLGLPVLDALNYGKNVLVVDRPLNHELENIVDEFKGKMHYYTSYPKLRELIETLELQEMNKNLYKRSWKDVSEELCSLFTHILSKEIDI